MGRLLEFFLLNTIKLALKVRYRVTIKGLEKINCETMNRKGGILFLPNHPTIFVDPTLVGMTLWQKFSVRPVIVEYMFFTPIVNWFMHRMKALPMPNFAVSSNSIKRRQSERAIEELTEALREGDNFMFYPAGRVQRAAYERIGGASGLHRILQEAPESNVVLVRTKGLWGSSFSRAQTGKTPAMFPTIFAGMKKALKNLIFFTPKREVEIEFVPAPADFPYEGTKRELNRYLEEFYSRPDGMADNPPDYRGDSLVLVPYNAWSQELPTAAVLSEQEEEKIIDEATIPDSVKKKVYREIAQLAQTDVSQIDPSLNLSVDLGFDSLDIADVAAFLEDTFNVKGLRNEDITTVGKVLSFAAGQEKIEMVKEGARPVPKKWLGDGRSGRATVPPGATISEVFLKNCERMGAAVACADNSSGALSYKEVKMRAILLARYIRQMEGKYIGVMLPASVAGIVIVLACQLAGKVPVMINWTVGPRHLKSVVASSGIKQVLSAWSFVDRLDNIEFGPLDDMTVMLENVKRKLTLKDKLLALIWQYRSPQAILKSFGLGKAASNDEAVLLFTSGTESAPKGVPLTHDNILSNHRAALQAIHLDEGDSLFNILPPFHSFGFTVTGLLPILSGIKVACYPDPTDSPRLAEEIRRWEVTVMVGAPTFVKGMLKAADPAQLKSLRLVVYGAEKSPPDFIESISVKAPEAVPIEGYGITECSPVLTMTPPDEPRVGVGRALPGVELCVIHPETHEVLPVGEQGLIIARGPNIFKGYLNGDDVRNPFVTVNGYQWYDTGDLGYLDADGYLILSGRLKRFVKIGGEMVSLAALEYAFLQAADHQGWSLKDEGPSLAVCAKEVPGEKPKMVLFTTFDASADQANRALREAGFSNLVKVTDIKVMDTIPVMGTGKIDYRGLEAQYFTGDKCV